MIRLEKKNFISKFDKKIIKFAKGKKEIINDLRDQKHVSVIVRNKKIINWGTNNTKTNPLMLKYNEFRLRRFKNYDSQRPHIQYDGHAELVALSKVLNSQFAYYLNEMTIYVFRFNKRNEIVFSKPCPMCEKAIIDYKFKKVIYS